MSVAAGRELGAVGGEHCSRSDSYSGLLGQV